MANDAEKLEVISGYYRLLDEDTKRRLERIKQMEGAGRSLLPVGYGQLLAGIYDIHIRFEKEKDLKCAQYKEIIEKIKSETHGECIDEIRKFLVSNIGRGTKDL